MAEIHVVKGVTEPLERIAEALEQIAGLLGRVAEDEAVAKVLLAMESEEFTPVREMLRKAREEKSDVSDI